MQLAMEGKSLEEAMIVLAERIDTICNTKEEALRNNFRKSKLFLVQMTYQKARKVYEKEKAESTNGNMPVGGSGSPVLRRSSSAELAGTFGVDQTVAREEIEKAGGNFVDAGKALLRIALTINTEKNAETMRVQDCANCHERDATVVYIPCGHLVYCEKCHDICKKNLLLMLKCAIVHRVLTQQRALSSLAQRKHAVRYAKHKCPHLTS